MADTYGIDLGTCYSCIAYVDDAERVSVIPNRENDRITPSVVFFDSPNNIVVGQVAKQNAEAQPDAVAEMFKREMGNPAYVFVYADTEYRPEELSSLVLRKVVQDAAQHLGREIKNVVITCPAWFGAAEKEATAKAGELAGLNVREIINEPTAAAIAYGYDAAQDEVVLVYDLGGGTFDVTMIEIKANVITVICTGGSHELGGKDWDKAIVDYCVAEYSKNFPNASPPLDDLETVQDLTLKAENAKKQLTVREKDKASKIRVTHDGNRYTVELTRELFDTITADKLERTITLTREMLTEAQKKGCHKFSKILLTGGSTRMPQVLERLTAEFGGVGAGIEIVLHDPDEAVAKGAARYAHQLEIGDKIRWAVAEKTGQKPEDVDVKTTSRDIVDEAVEQVSNELALPRGTVESAANSTISNVTSKSYGVVVMHDGAKKVALLIKRNDVVPTTATQVFAPDEDGQDFAEISLMESTATDDIIAPADAEEISQAMLPLPAGIKTSDRIEVCFNLTNEGRLKVAAKELKTNKQIDIEVKIEGVMSAEETQKAKSRMLARTVE